MDIIRKTIRKAKAIREKQLFLWLIPTKDGRVKKVKIGWFHVTSGLCMILTVAVGTIYVGIDYSRFLAAKKRVQQLVNKSREATMFADLEEDYQDSLVSQIRFLTEEHRKSKEYEDQVRQRLSVLRSTLESGVPMELFDEVKVPAGDKGDKDVGGAELDCDDRSGTGLPCLPKAEEIRAELNWSFNSLLPTAERGQDLIKTIDRFITVLEKLPIVRPVMGWVNSGFGLRRSPFTHKMTKHQGIDFSVPYNSPVVATADGTVRSVTRTRTYGLLIDIEHTDRVITRYAHLAKAKVKIGQKVCRGEIIALSGSSGRSTGPHLHYEIRVDKKPIDPRSFLSSNLSLKGDLLQQGS